MPAPERLVALTAPQRGLTERKVEQLRALGAAALKGRLSRARLRSMTGEEAARDLQQLAGIGPFSAELIMIRGVGDPDALPHHEQRLARAVRAAYRLPEDADIESVANTWRPYRSWVGLLLRSWLEAETGDIVRGRQSQSPPALTPDEPPRERRTPAASVPPADPLTERRGDEIRLDVSVPRQGRRTALGLDGVTWHVPMRPLD